MFGPITIPFGVKLLLNTLKLKPGVTYDDIELALAEMCNVVKETYGGDEGGFIAGQVFQFSGFVSQEGSLGNTSGSDHDMVIATYWRCVRRARTIARGPGVPSQDRCVGRVVQ